LVVQTKPLLPEIHEVLINASANAWPKFAMKRCTEQLIIGPKSNVQMK